MLYNVKANVFAVKLGSQFGKQINTVVVANSKEDAIEEGKISMKTYCKILEKHHNNDFSFDNLVIE